MALREENRPARTLPSIVPSPVHAAARNGASESIMQIRAQLPAPRKLCPESAPRLYNMLYREARWEGPEGTGRRRRRAARIARDLSLGMLVHDTGRQVNSVIAMISQALDIRDSEKTRAASLVMQLADRGLGFRQIMSEVRKAYIADKSVLSGLSRDIVASEVAWSAVARVYISAHHSVKRAVDGAIESFAEAGNYHEAILTAIEFNVPLDRWRNDVAGPKDPCCVSELIRKSGNSAATARFAYDAYMKEVHSLAGDGLSGGTDNERHKAAVMAMTASDIAKQYKLGREPFVDAAGASMHLFLGLEHPAKEIAGILYMRCLRE